MCPPLPCPLSIPKSATTKGSLRRLRLFIEKKENRREPCPRSAAKGSWSHIIFTMDPLSHAHRGAHGFPQGGSRRPCAGGTTCCAALRVWLPPEEGRCLSHKKNYKTFCKSCVRRSCEPLCCAQQAAQCTLGGCTNFPSFPVRASELPSSSPNPPKLSPSTANGSPGPERGD